MPKSEERCKEIREATRTKILHESALYFARNGFVKTKMSDLAKYIGIGQGSIYVYFKSKEELYEEIRRMVSNDKEVADIKKLSTLPISAKKKIQILAEHVLKSMKDDEMYAAKVTLNTQLMMEESKYDSDKSMYQTELYKYTAKIIEKGQKEGTVVLDDSMALADYFWSVVYLYALKSQFSSHFKMIDAWELERVLLKDSALER